MSKIEELQTKIDELQKELDELKEKEKETESGGAWRPKMGEGYFFIDGNILRDVYGCFLKDTARFSIGNGFKTKEEAEFIVEKLKVLAELKVFAEPKDREWDGENHHYEISYCIEKDGVFVDFWKANKTNSVYFESKEKAQQAIDAVGVDRIKKYYLEVE